MTIRIGIVIFEGAEELDFVPLNLGASGSPPEGLYAANYNLNVAKMDASQFAGLQGHIIVTGETTSGIWDVNPSSTPTTVGTFTRPLCPYPQEARYVGPADGDLADAANYGCMAPN